MPPRDGVDIRSRGKAAKPAAAATRPVEAPQPSTGLKPSPPPMEDAPFTFKQVRDAIPAHCFERSALRSGMYAVWDLVRVAAMGLAATHISGTGESLGWWAPYVLWPLYWWCQGCVMTGIWVVAHECGHQAFSSSKTINDSVGLVLHSALLVPYHSWRITHGNHHKFTAHMDDDEVFLPATRSDFAAEMIEETPIASLIGMFNMLFFGWPLYLTINIAGPKKYKDVSPNSHFHPRSKLFQDRDYNDIVISDVVFFAAFGGLCWAIYSFGFSTVLFYYIVPYLIVNYHLVLITYLQHTATYIPHYRGDRFTFLKGALSTVDRSFGPVLDSTFHHISNTHVAHHLFSQMPHYHAHEATECIKKVLGKYYLKDDTPIWSALYNSWRTCRFVEDEGDKVWYKGPEQYVADK